MIIYIAMFIGIVVSVINKFPSAIKVERNSLYEELYDSVIECEYRNRKLQLKRWMLILCMAVTTWLTVIVSYYLLLAIICIILYLIIFFLHYRISYALDKKFYCTKDGIWFDKPEGLIHSYDKIVVIKTWRTTVAFSGYSDWLEVEFAIDEEKYILSCPNKEDDEELDLLKWVPDIKEHEITEEEKRKFGRRGWSGVIVGLCLMFACAGIVMSESGVENSMTIEDEAYKTVLYEEQARHGYVNTIFESSDGTLYVLFDQFGSVNVYDNTGSFLRAYKVPLGTKGAVEMAIKDNIIYIKNRDDVIFVYSDKEYLGMLSFDEFMIEGISFVEEGENLDKENVIGRAEKTPLRDMAPFGFMIGLILIIYNFTILKKGSLAV